MITVTLGTIAYPFDRSVAWIEQLLQQNVIDEPIYIQHGYSSIAALENHPLVTTIPTLPRETLEQLVDQSRLVIAHGGQGTTRMLIKRQASFIILPRLSRNGEHVDDHQLVFAQSTQSLGVRYGLVVSDLRSAILNPPPPVKTQFFDGPKLSTYLLKEYPAPKSQSVPQTIYS